MTLRTQEDRQILNAAAKVRARLRKEAKPARLARKKAVIESLAKGKRESRQHDNGYLAFLRRLPCCVCGATPSDAAHTRFSRPEVGRINPGMGCKPSDRFATPLCRVCHTEQHATNERAWWASKGIDPDALSASLYAAYLAGSDGAEIVARFSPSSATRKSVQERVMPKGSDQ